MQPSFRRLRATRKPFEPGFLCVGKGDAAVGFHGNVHIPDKIATPAIHRRAIWNGWRRKWIWCNYGCVPRKANGRHGWLRAVGAWGLRFGVLYDMAGVGEADGILAGRLVV